MMNAVLRDALAQREQCLRIEVKTDADDVITRASSSGVRFWLLAAPGGETLGVLGVASNGNPKPA